MPVSSYPSIINSILPYVDINMSIPKMIELAIKSKELYNYDIKQLEFPLKDYRYEAKLARNNSFVIKWDKVENIKELQNFIYEKQIIKILIFGYKYKSKDMENLYF